MSSLLTIIGCLMVAICPGASAPVPSQSYTHNAILVNPDLYHVYWQFNSTSITFEVHVKTTGYVGFGISPNGKMEGSDMIIGWVKDGVTHFKDRHATGHSLPSVDVNQNWVLLAGSETAGYTILKFSRSLISCDKSKDLDITSGTIRLIYAYKDGDPTGDVPTYHGAQRRGSKSIQLLSDHTKPEALPGDAKYIDFLNPNVSVPNTDTTYWCKGFKVPDLGGKKHIVMVEPLVQAGHEALVHHILLYTCWHEINDSAAQNAGAKCFTANMPGDIIKCTSPMFAWAIGGGKFYFPSHSGYPLGGPNDPTFIRMETHYDNPSLRSGLVDGSGLRLWYTAQLRKNDAGVLEVGMQVTPEQIIPPQLSSFINTGYCSGTCMSQAFGSSQPKGINVFASMVHTHLAGTGVRVNQVRNGKELPTLTQDLTYDFDFQETRHLPKDVTILPTDDLIVRCYYKTTGRTSYTVGGISSRSEMCLAYLLYYPRVNLTNCESVPPFSQSLKIGGNLDVTDTNSYPYHKITSNGPFKDKNVFDVITATDWTSASNVQKFQNYISSGPIKVRCEMSTAFRYPVNGQTINSVAISTSYTEPTPQCTPKSTAPNTLCCPLLITMLIALATTFGI